MRRPLRAVHREHLFPAGHAAPGGAPRWGATRSFEAGGQTPAVGPLGGREQRRREAGRRHLELEPDNPLVLRAEVERHGTREGAVGFEQQRGPERSPGRTRRSESDATSWSLRR